MPYYVVAFLLGVCSLHLFKFLPNLDTLIYLSFGILLSIFSIVFVLPIFLNSGKIKIFISNGINPFYLNSNKNLSSFKPNFLIVHKNFIYKIIAIAFVFLLGFLWVLAHATKIQSQWLPHELENIPIKVVGQIVSVPEKDEKKNSMFDFQIKEIHLTTASTHLSSNILNTFEFGKVRLRWGASKFKSIHASKNKQKKTSGVRKKGKKSLKDDQTEKPHNQIEKPDVNDVNMPKGNISNPSLHNLIGTQLHHKNSSNRDPPNVSVGEIWEFTVKLKSPHGYANVGSFDEERHFFQQGLIARGSVLTKHPYCLMEKGSSDFPIEKLREKLRSKIRSSLQSLKERFVIIALILGFKEGITQEQWKVFRDTGTAHLMAISGLHIGLLAGFVYGCISFVVSRIRFIILRVPAHWLASLGSCFISGGYALLSGFSVPAVRAFIMVAVFTSGTLLRRVRTRFQSFFISLGIVLLWDPLSTLSIGFWLSFGAVFILLYATQNIGSVNLDSEEEISKSIGSVNTVSEGGISNLPVRFWNGLMHLLSGVTLQWKIFLGLLPVTLLMFQKVSLVSPLANAVAIPWVSFVVVPLALIGLFLCCFMESLSHLFLSLSCKALSLIWPFLEWLSQFQNATWIKADYSLPAMILAMMGILLILAPKGIPGRFLGFFWVIPLILSRAPKIVDRTLQMTVLDVGQGLAAIIETPHHVLVYDTGAKWNIGTENGSDCGERVLVPYLQSRAIQKIDTVIISHKDNDHIGGLNSLLKSIPANKILTPEVSAIPRSNVYTCAAGQKWEWDGISFEMLHPTFLPSSKQKRNDLSCVLKVSLGKQSILLTGDIESKGEKLISDRYKPILPSTILLVPHHGSKTSSSIEFLQNIQPNYAVVTTGYFNGYGHPKPTIMKRYEELGIPMFQTVNSGSVSFLLGEGNEAPVITEYRREHKRYWNRD